jgi:parallel beta-helix repeat protein
MLTLAFDIQPVNAEPKTICVDDDNTTGPWDGSSENPYRNITSALTHVSTGDTVFVCNGTYYEHVIISKSISLVGENTGTTIIDGNYLESVVKITTSNVEVSGFTLRHSGQDSRDCGVFIDGACHNRISHNSVINCTVGIYFAKYSDSNTVCSNTVWSNNHTGILLRWSCDNFLVDNTVSHIRWYGIALDDDCYENVVADNLVSNSLYGFGVDDSDNNVLVHNGFYSNTYGIQIHSSINNTIFHNNLINNTVQVTPSESLTNFWDDGYPSGGNYWSDYTGKDYNHGQNQDELGSDGIGDTPYVIDENNTDHYPLMVPWGESYDWPMFHHDPTHTGYSTSKAPTTNSTIWTYKTGEKVWSSPAVVDGRVHVGSFDFNVYCLNTSTGAHIWSYTTGERVESSPAVAGGKVYVGSVDGKVYCLNASTGAHIWNYTTGNAVRSSPVVVDGKLYVGSYDRNVYCLNASTGAHIWDYTTGHSVYSSPAVADGKVYVGSWDSKIYCLDATTGMLIWNYTTSYGVYSSPAVADGKVYVGSGDYNVYCLNASTGAHIWNYTTGERVHSSPAIVGCELYVGSYDRKVYCLNASTGTHIWDYTTGAELFSSPAVADGKVYVGSNDNRVYCLNSTTGAHIWNYIIGADVFSSPAVAYGRVYVGSYGGEVYAFGEHDVAVINLQGVCCSDYSIQIDKNVVCKNCTACANVTVANDGGYVETTIVALWAQNVSTHQIGATVLVTLDPGESNTVTFFFNSTNLPKGNYTIFAKATTVQGETDTADNTYLGGWIFVVHPGDLDCDGHVFLYDLTILGTAWDSRPGDDTWCANADIDGDCHVFLYDLTILGSHWDEYD